MGAGLWLKRQDRCKLVEQYPLQKYLLRVDVKVCKNLIIFNKNRINGNISFIKLVWQYLYTFLQIVESYFIQIYQMFEYLPLNQQYKPKYILLALLAIIYIQQCNSLHSQHKPKRMLQTQISNPTTASNINENRVISTYPIQSSLSNYNSDYIMPGVQPWQHKLTQLLFNAYLGRQTSATNTNLVNNNRINSNLQRNSDNGVNVIINNNVLPYNPSIAPSNLFYPPTYASFTPTYVNPNPYLSSIYAPTVIPPQIISNTIPSTNQNFQNNAVPTNQLKTTTNAELQNQKVKLMGQSINQRITSQLLNSLMRSTSTSSKQIQQPSIQIRNISVKITFNNENTNTTINKSATPDFKPSNNPDTSSIPNVAKNDNSSTGTIDNKIIPNNSKANTQTNTEVKVKAEVEKVNLNLRNTQTNQNTKPTFLTDITLSYREYVQLYPQKRTKNAQEESLRKRIYEQNIKNINNFNKNALRTYSMGYNLFTDYEEGQFQKLFLKLVVPPQFVKRVQVASISKQKYEKPENISINWSCKSGVVHNLTKCPVSYIFAPLDSIQITGSINKQILNPLSVQQFISCVKDKYLNGCYSGFYDKVFLEACSHGIVQDANYYYDYKLNSNGVTPKCDQNRLKNAKRIVTIQESNIIEPGNCKEIVFQLRYRSLAVAIWAKKFQFYKQGKFSPEQINNNANLGLTLVGYHPQKGYLVKNSWGLQWGLKGHAYVSQQTGVCNYAFYGVLQDELTNNFSSNQSEEKLPLPELCNESQII